MTSHRDDAPDGDLDARQLQAALPAIAPSELVRLRRGELDASAVAALLERTAGLAAPPAPSQGDLPPNQSGWLIGAGQPPSMQDGAVSKRARALSLLSYPLYFFTLELLHWHWPFAFVFALAPLAFAFGAAKYPRVRLKRQLEQAGQVFGLADVPDGTLVRVSGTILPQPTVPTLFRGIPAVLFRNRIGWADETRGLDFLLALDNGEQAKVAVRGSFLVERPTRTREPPACGPVSAETVISPDTFGRNYVLRSDMLRGPPLFSYLLARYESSVGPGDRVEVCGVVRHVLAPELRSLREVPTRPVLGAGEDTPLLIRRPVGANSRG
jgi:hypothetical protein